MKKDALDYTSTKFLPFNCSVILRLVWIERWVLIQVPLLYNYVLINDLGDSIDLVHRQQVTIISTVAYNFILIMDFQHLIEIGERLKLEGPQVHAFVEKELDKMRIKEEAAAAREDRAAERLALKEAAERERLALKEANEQLA